MSIGIKGIRLDTLNIGKEADERKLTGQYSLISTTDKVLAKQGFNSYNDLTIAWSPATVKAMDSFMAAVKADLDMTLGLEEGGEKS